MASNTPRAYPAQHISAQRRPAQCLPRTVSRPLPHRSHHPRAPSAARESTVCRATGTRSQPAVESSGQDWQMGRQEVGHGLAVAAEWDHGAISPAAIAASISAKRAAVMAGADRRVRWPACSRAACTTGERVPPPLVHPHERIVGRFVGHAIHQSQFAVTVALAFHR